MVEALRIPQYKISKHLMILKYAGLVDCERDGTWAHYFLRKDDPSLQCLFRFLKRFARPGLSGIQRGAGLKFLDGSAGT
jgi:DNA-binding transcriptional ArsR family regulator